MRLAELDQLFLCFDVDVVVVMARGLFLLALHVRQQLLVLDREVLDLLRQGQNRRLHLVSLELPLHVGV